MGYSTLKQLTLITSYFESPFYQDRAPYNEQLFLKLKDHYDINIIRPIPWTDILKVKYNNIKLKNSKKLWNLIPIGYPVYFYIPKVGLVFNGLFYFLSIITAFVKQRRMPDFIYTTWAYPDGYAAMLLSAIIQRSYILRVHGSDINDLAHRDLIKNKVLKVLKSAAYIISPSEDLKVKMTNLGVNEEKIKVVYSGVDKEIFYKTDKILSENYLGLPNRKRILYIGNFKEAKGVIDIIKAVDILRNSNHDIQLCMIGKGSAETIMRSYIEEQGLQKKVVIIGVVEHKKLAPWINASNCVCLPSYAEGVPNVLLEAMGCETNIVATRVGGIPEIVSNPESVLVEPGDINALARKLETTLEYDKFVTLPAIELSSYDLIANRISNYIECAIS